METTTPSMKCGRKFVSPCPNVFKFLDQLCFSRFDVGIWSSITQPNFKPMVNFLFGKRSWLRLTFVQGNEKCDNTCLAIDYIHIRS
jgi:hypothetical protein